MARTTIATVGFLDRLGDRVVVADRSGGDLEVLRLRPELTGDPAFETCLKARGEQLSTLQHRSLARVRGVSRLPSPDGRLAVVSEAVKGWRLSEVLQAAEQESRQVHTTVVLFLLRQVASAIAALHAVGPDVSHGALGPERVVIAPGGRVFVVEYVLGSALSHLPPLAVDRLWKDLRLAVPSDVDDDTRFGPRTDVLQLGLIGLSLVHNRQLRRDEYPGRLGDLVESATESQLVGDRQPVGANLRTWLSRTLQLATDKPAWSMAEAQQGLEWLVSKEGGYLSTPVGLEPLLQSVARFFTVAPADDASSPANATVAVMAARPSAALAPSREPAAAPAAAATPAMTIVEPARGDEPEVVDSQSVQETTARVPAAVDSMLPAPVAKPEVPGDRQPQTPANEPELDDLVVKPSPLAEFAAERVTDAPPESDVTRPTRPPQDLPWPAPPPRSEPVQPALPTDVGPVADMLSLNRPAAPRRATRRQEPWVSSLEERVGGPHRVSPPESSSPSVTKSGPVAVASGKPADAAPAPDVAGVGPSKSSTGSVQAAARPAVEPRAPGVADRPSGGAAAKRVAEPRSDRVSAAGSPASFAAERTADSDGASGAARAARQARPPIASSAVPSRSLFGATDGTSSADSPEDEGSSGGSMTKWIAAAAAVIVLALGGFTAWKYFKSPTVPPMPAETAAAEKRPAAPPASSPAPAPVRESAVQPAASAPAGAPAPVPPPEAAVATGAIQLVSPVKLMVAEGGQALGSSERPISLPAGRHILDVTNEELGVHVSRSVDVRPGRPSRVEVPLPRGSVNINATPWADVFIDGQRVGETPLANVPLTVGSHEVRFKHPQLGEQVRSVVVVAGSTGRLSVDMK